MRSLSRAILDSGRELDDDMNGGDSTFKSARTATGLSFEIEYTEFSIHWAFGSVVNAIFGTWVIDELPRMEARSRSSASERPIDRARRAG